MQIAKEGPQNRCGTWGSGSGVSRLRDAWRFGGLEYGLEHVPEQVFLKTQYCPGLWGLNYLLYWETVRLFWAPSEGRPRPTRHREPTRSV